MIAFLLLFEYFLNIFIIIDNSIEQWQILIILWLGLFVYLLLLDDLIKLLNALAFLDILHRLLKIIDKFLF